MNQHTANPGRYLQRRQDALDLLTAGLLYREIAPWIGILHSLVSTMFHTVDPVHFQRAPTEQLRQLNQAGALRTRAREFGVLDHAPALDVIQLMGTSTHCARPACRIALTPLPPLGRPLPATSGLLAYIVPLERGGAGTLANLHVICAKCRTQQGTHLLADMPEDFWGGPLPTGDVDPRNRTYADSADSLAGS